MNKKIPPLFAQQGEELMTLSIEVLGTFGQVYNSPANSD